MGEVVTVNSEQATYSIGVAARMTGTSVHTLRMWERRYKLLSGRRTQGGQRAYTLADIDHLKLLKALTNKGVRIGDIAKLPVNQLMSLLMENGEQNAAELRTLYRVLVVGEKNMALCTELKNRFPQCTFSLVDHPQGFNSERLLENLLKNSSDMLSGIAMSSPDIRAVLVLSLPAIQPTIADALISLSEVYPELLVGVEYINPSARQALEKNNIGFFQPHDKESFSTAMRELFSRELMPNPLAAAAESAGLGLPSLHPQLFSDTQLSDIEQKKTMLSCECPPHIVELIRKLSAFEEYSRGCEIENENEAVVHACVYAYSAQARHLMEKALLAVANSHDEN